MRTRLHFLLVHGIALAALTSCIGDVSSTSTINGNLDGLPADAFDDTIVPSTGHLGWTAGAFGVSPDGAAGYTIPLWAPAGRAGIEPNLALSYSSRSADSIVGVGWSLSGLSAITRCARTRSIDGEDGPRPVDFEDDVFCLDGQRLIAVDPADIGGLTQRLRPLSNRTSSIEFVGSATAPTQFLVHETSGQTLTYSQTVAGRRWVTSDATRSDPDAVAEQMPEAETYAWLLTRLEDASGNYLTVEYETVHHGAAHYDAVEVRPRFIDYTGHPSLGPGQRFVAFSYDEAPSPVSVRFVNGLALGSSQHVSRVRAYSHAEVARSYELGYSTSSSTQRSLLTSVTECDGQGACREPLTFNYTNGFFPTVGSAFDTGIVAATEYSLSGLQPSGVVSVADFDGDGAAELLLPVDGDGASDGFWHVMRFGAEAATLEVDDTDISAADALLPMDYDGDGRSEVFRQPGSSLTAMASIDRLLPVPGGYERSFLHNQPQCGPYATGQSLGRADPLGTGFATFITQCVSDSDIPTVYGNRYWWAGGDLWIERMWSPESVVLEPHPFQAISLDASNRSTIIYETDSIFNSIDWESDTSHVVNVDTDGRWVFLDVNGDGLSDAFNLFDAVSGAYIRLNMGGVFGPKIPAFDVLPSMPEYEYATEADVRIADFNSDGRDDFALLVHAWYAEGRPAASGSESRDAMMVHLSNGRGFTTVGAGDVGEPGEAIYVGDPEGTLPLGGGGSTVRRVAWPRTQLLDADGDGDLEMLFQPSIYGDHSLISTHLYTRPLYAGTPDLLRWVERTGRPQVSVTYGRDATLTGTCAGSVVCGTHPLTVATHTDELGILHQHSYAGPRFDAEGGGWLGFSRHTVHEVVPGRDGIRATDTYFEAPPGANEPAAGDSQYGFRDAHLGQPRVELRYVSEPNGLGILTGRFTEYGLAPGPYPISVPTTVHMREWRDLGAQEWALPAQTESPALTLAAFPTPGSSRITQHVDQSLEYGLFGVPTRVTETIPDSGSTVIEAVVNRDYDRWLLGITSSLTVTSTTAEGLTQQRASSFDWGYTQPGGGILHPHLLRRTTREPLDTGSLFQTTDYVRNSRGLVKQLTISTIGGAPRTTKIEYDDEGIHAQHLTNAVGHERWLAVDPALGVVVYDADVRGVGTRRQFDGFGRLRQETGHGTSGAVQYLDTPLGDSSEMEVVQTTSTGDEQQRLVDPFGRTLRTRSRGFDGWVIVEPEYDDLGRVSRVEEPHYEIEMPVAFATLRYDAADQVREVELADGTTMTATRSGRTRTEIDARGHATTTTLDLAGRTVVTQEAPANGTSPPTVLTYTYGPFGQVRQMRDHRGFTWTWQRDPYGRVLFAHDPDAGDRFYEHNGFDELDRELEWGGGPTRTDYDYDALSRPTLVSSAVDGDVTFEWDTHGPGLLARSTRVDDAVARAYQYDGFGRVEAETTIVGDEEFRMDWGYDTEGRLATVTYPQVAGTRRALTYSYERSFVVGVAEGASSIWEAVDYDARGRLSEESFGNGVEARYDWADVRSWLDGLEVEGPSGGLLADITYTHDAEANVTGRSDTTLTVDGAETYTYDALDRLATLAVGTSPLETFGYDDLGNLVSRTGRAQTFSPTFPHRLATSGGVGLTHDARGRMLTGPDWAVTEYTDFNLPRTLTSAGVSASFRYDASGQRVVKQEGSRRTVTIDGLYEHRDGATPTDTWNVSVGGRTVAQYSRTGAGERLFYLHSDALGSPRVVTDEVGNDVERYAYDVYGDQSAIGANGAFASLPTGPERPTLTGHSSDGELGLINMRGRMYDPTLGRFLTPDPLVHSATSRQAWNAYSYVGNNPVTHADPSGFDWVDDPDGGHIVAPGSGGATEMSSFWNGFNGWDGFGRSSPQCGVGATECRPSPSGGPPPPTGALSTAQVTIDNLRAGLAGMAALRTPAAVGVEYCERSCPSCHDPSGRRGIPWYGPPPPELEATSTVVVGIPMAGMAAVVGTGATAAVGSVEAYTWVRAIHFVTQMGDGAVASAGGMLETGAVPTLIGATSAVGARVAGGVYGPVRQVAFGLDVGLGVQEGFRGWALRNGLHTYTIAPARADRSLALRARDAMYLADEIHFNMRGFNPPAQPMLELNQAMEAIGGWTNYEYSVIRTEFPNAQFWVDDVPYTGPHPFGVP